MVDFRQDRLWGEYLKKRGWQYDYVRSYDGRHKIQVIVVKIGFWPWTLLKVQRGMNDPDFEDLKRIKKKYHVIQTVIEPLKIEDTKRFAKAGFKLARMPFLATKTVVNDLNKSKEDMWLELSENAKRLIKKNEALKIERVGWKDFFNQWKKWSKVWTLSERELNQLQETFKNNCQFWVIGDDKGWHSALLSLTTKDVFNYYQTFTTDLGRKSGAHYRLVWETMLWAKDKGYKHYDFEGIFDSAYPIKKWQGFTEFKKKFGGRVITHPGSWVKWF